MTAEPNSVLVMQSDYESVRAISGWISELLALEAINEFPSLHGRLELALHEVCVNIIDHSYLGGPGVITVAGWITVDRVTLRVADTGVPFDEATAVPPSPGVAQIRGYGLMLVRQLIDELRYVRTADTNEWWLSIERMVGASQVSSPAGGTQGGRHDH